jgi:hypothetical protein
VKSLTLIVLFYFVAVKGICQDPALSKNRELEISLGSFSTWNSSNQVSVNPIISWSWDDYYIENRFNYEAINSASINAGKRILRKLNHIEIIPMAGLVFGSFKGVNGELQVSMDYSKWDLFIDNQYSYEYTDALKSFYSNWSVVRYKLTTMLSIGLSDFFVWKPNGCPVFDKGITASISWAKWSVRLYAFNYEKEKRQYWLGIRYNIKMKLKDK